MIINNLVLYFDRQEGNNLFFKTDSGEEIAIDKKLLMDSSVEKQKVFLNLSEQEIFAQSKDILNEILEGDKE